MRKYLEKRENGVYYIAEGYNEDKINSSVFEFIEIYAYFGRYSASYRYMVSMAKENDTWVYINESTLFFRYFHSKTFSLIHHFLSSIFLLK